MQPQKIITRPLTSVITKQEQNLLTLYHPTLIFAPKNFFYFSIHQGLSEFLGLKISRVFLQIRYFSKCIPKECSQITQESECKDFIYDIPNETFIPCIWQNSKCNEVSEKDFETFDFQKCFQFGMTHYTWQPSTSKCKQCSLVDRFKYNPSENPNSDSKDQNNGISILQWALMWIATQI